LKETEKKRERENRKFRVVSINFLQVGWRPRYEDGPSTSETITLPICRPRFHFPYSRHNRGRRLQNDL
jgi:hypothetical protein